MLVAKCAEATSIFIRVVNGKIRESVNVKLPGAGVVSLHDLQSEIYEARFPHYNDTPVKAIIILKLNPLSLRCRK